MDLIITQQLIYFCQSIFLGVISSFIFDFFKILRLSIKHNNIFIFIEDIIFFIILSLLTYNFMINISFGQIRIFILIGELIGFILYKFSISDFIVKSITYIISIISALFKLIFNFLLFPTYKFTIKFIKLLSKPFLTFFTKYFKIIEKPLKNKISIVYNLFKLKFFKNKILHLYLFLILNLFRIDK